MKSRDFLQILHKQKQALGTTISTSTAMTKIGITTTTTATRDVAAKDGIINTVNNNSSGNVIKYKPLFEHKWMAE